MKPEKSLDVKHTIEDHYARVPHPEQELWNKDGVNDSKCEVDSCSGHNSDSSIILQGPVVKITRTPVPQREVICLLLGPSSEPVHMHVHQVPCEEYDAT